METASSSAQQQEVWIYTPFANFDQVKCVQPLPLEFRARMLREQILRQWSISLLDYPLPYPFIVPKISSSSDFPSMVWLLNGVDPFHAVTQFDVIYKDTLARRDSVVRDMLGRFFKLVKKVPVEGIDDHDHHPIYTIAQHDMEDAEAMHLFPEPRSIGRAFGLALLFNIPVGFAIDAELLAYLMTKQPTKFARNLKGEAPQSTRSLWLMNKGFNEIVCGLELSRYMTVAEFGRVLRGNPDSALSGEELRQCVARDGQVRAGEDVGNLCVAPKTAFSSDQTYLLQILFEYLESRGRVADFVRSVTGQHVVPFGALRMCPEIQIVYVLCDNDQKCDDTLPTATLTHNRFLLPEYSSKHALYRQMDRFFDPP